jgi:3-hydroxyisobutyrate dehydrogenase-like beta-hydroxyacid dehydrogenase
MGGRLARRVLDAGYRTVVWNRTAAKAAPLAASGAKVAATPAAAAAEADVLLTAVADPTALRVVVEGADGVAAGARESLTVIEMSTVGPAAVARLAATLPAGVGVLDAPVLGGVTEAESGSLTLFVGGPPSLVERWTPLLSLFGRALEVGPLGAGAAAKLVANTTLFGVLGLLGEAVSFGRALGLRREVVFEVLAATPLAQQAARRREAIETGGFPLRFRLSLARKDAELIRTAAAAEGADLRLAAAAQDWLADAEAAGLGDRDYSAVLAHIAASPDE